MSKETKRTTIEGTAFRCEACDQVFITGPAGFEPVKARVVAHFNATGHTSIAPINPPVGMTYETLAGRMVGLPYGYGEENNRDEWIAMLKTKGPKAIQPRYALMVGGDAVKTLMKEGGMTKKEALDVLNEKEG